MIILWVPLSILAKDKGTKNRAGFEGKGKNTKENVMNTNKLNTLMAALIFGTLAWTASNTASAHEHHEHFGGGIVIGGGSDRQWVEGHYEVRFDSVMVSPAHYEKIETPAQFETRVDETGKLVTVEVAPATCQKVFVPAQYESREVRVWVPGYWADTGYRSGGVRVGLGLHF